MDITDDAPIWPEYRIDKVSGADPRIEDWLVGGYVVSTKRPTDSDTEKPLLIFIPVSGNPNLWKDAEKNFESDVKVLIEAAYCNACEHEDAQMEDGRERGGHV